MLPVISVVGNSGVGKTTFLEKLIPELKRRGYRVAAIKHDAHKFEVDYPGKDSWRLTQAGSDVTVISSRDKMAMMERLENELDLNQIVEMVRDRVDIVVTEGYRGAAAAKIEVSRRAHSHELTAPLSDLIALVTDQPFEMGVPEFGLDDSSSVAGFIEDKFRPRPSRLLDRVFG
jgi:molybdopterin-guanine dinucleotide biosynthesis protein MobB